MFAKGSLKDFLRRESTYRDELGVYTKSYHGFSVLLGRPLPLYYMCARRHSTSTAMQLNPGQRVLFGGSAGTIERRVGDNEFIVKMKGGRRIAVDGNRLTFINDVEVVEEPELSVEFFIDSLAELDLVVDADEVNSWSEDEVAEVAEWLSDPQDESRPEVLEITEE